MPPPFASLLPAQPTPLIGRERDVGLVLDHLARPTVRLLTLTGPAGTGKTRLALAAAGQVLDRAPDGAVVLVDLAPISDPALVSAAIAHALGLREDRGDQAPLDRVREALGDRHLLLVLDNVEQVVGAAPQVAALLAACPNLKVLATSRASLRLRWEHELAVPPLAVPDPGDPPSPDRLAGVPAVALFLDRARAVNPDFGLTADNAAAIAAICVRLDGLPLAIELAAARVKLFSPRALLARLDRSADLLRADTQDRPDRHLTLRAALDWSFHLLAPAERRLLRVLSVFVGGCALADVARVAERDPADADLLAELDALIDHSLLRQGSPPPGPPANAHLAPLLPGADPSVATADADAWRHEPRFRLLETVRQYGLERLADAGELDAARARHAATFADLAAAAAPEFAGPHQAAWLERLEREHDNLRAALRWCLEAGEPRLGARLGAGVWPFWSTRGHLREGRAWLAALADLLAAHQALATPDGATLLAGAGTLAFEQGDYPAAAALHQQALDLRRALGDQHGAAASLSSLGDVAHQQGDHAAAQALHEESLALLRALHDRPGVARALNQLGLTVRVRGDYAAARSLFDEALSISRDLGQRGWQALILNNLGRVAYYQADYPAARALHQRSLDIRRDLGDRRGIATSLGDLGDVAHQQGEYATADALRRESLALWRQLEDRWGLAYVLEGFGELAAVGQGPDVAVRLVAAATALREAIHAPRSPASTARLDRLLEAARQRLGGPGAFDRAWDEGWRMTPEEAAGLALGLPPPAAEPAPPAAADPLALGRLSRREREVAALVTRGLTNRQIAAELVIGERTVDTHVAHILAKLELTSRTQIATWCLSLSREQ